MNFSDLTPHGFCLAWQPGLIWLQAASDLLIAAAYYSIPAALLVFLRRRQDLAFRPIFGLFAAFIVACGTTHIMGVITLWIPDYWADGAIKALTAVLSVVTAIVLWPLLPKALALPSPDNLRRANAALAAGIAERDGVAAQLRASEARLKRFYARTPAPLHAMTPDLRLIEVSDRWLALLGYERAEVIGRPVTDFYVPEQHDAVRAMIAAARTGEDHGSAERRMVTRSGAIRDVEVAIDIEREAAEVQHVLVAVTDVTARKQAEAALAASEARLRQAQKMEAVGQLTGGVAHDFNNLLTSIQGALELLARDAALDARGQRRLDIALEASRRAARLTSQLLSFSRKQQLAAESLDPAQVVDGIRSLLDRTLEERAVLAVRPDAPLWPALADRNQLESALLNLAINARDAITPDTARDTGLPGEVVIHIENRSLARGEIERLTADPLVAGDYVAITVADTGHGMTEEVRARAIEPFFTTKPPGIGSGLGLSQVYGFARQSGGTLILESAPGRGTRATLLLPRAQTGAALPAPPPPAEPAPRPAGGNILVAEDDPLLRVTVTEALTEAGYGVIACESGEAALAALADTPGVRLLFTDVRMPGGMDGVALALAVRERFPQMPVVFATGYSERLILERWPEKLDMLQKPFTMQALAARIAALLTAAAPAPKTVA